MGAGWGEYCCDGRALLFDLTGDAGVRELGSRWGERLMVVRVRMKEGSELSAVFVRPDGCVAWAADGMPDLTEAEVCAEGVAWRGRRVKGWLLGRRRW